MIIYYWSPCLEKVGTYKSTIHSAVALAKYSKTKYKVKVVNSCGEWNDKKDFFYKNNVEVIDFGFNYYRFLPRLGYLASRFSYILIFLTSIIPLLRILIKEKPDYLIIHLITSLPLILNSFIKTNTKIILRISGFPKLNNFRKYFWKFSVSKVYKVTCPSIELKKQLLSLNLFNKNKVIFLADPIIRIREFVTKISKTSKQKKILNNKKFFISVGRLTKQKNFNYLINEFSNFIEKNKNFDLLIFGAGEDKQKLEELINEKNLQSKIKLMGYSQNVFQYMKKAEAFVLTSLWEDPGFVLIEAAFCNLFIISSDCSNGPKEILSNGKGGLLFKSNKKGELYNKLNQFLYLNKQKYEMKLLTKKNILKYTLFRHYLSFEQILT